MPAYPVNRKIPAFQANLDGGLKRRKMNYSAIVLEPSPYPL